MFIQGDRVRYTRNFLVWVHWHKPDETRFNYTQVGTVLRELKPQRFAVLIDGEEESREVHYSNLELITVRRYV